MSRELVPSICRKQTCINSSINQHQVQTFEHIWTCSLSLKIRGCISVSVHHCRVIESKQIVQITTCHWLWHLPILFTNMQWWDISYVCIIYGIWLGRLQLQAFQRHIYKSQEIQKLSRTKKDRTKTKDLETTVGSGFGTWNLDLSTGCPSWPFYNILWFYFIHNVFFYYVHINHNLCSIVFLISVRKCSSTHF